MTQRRNGVALSAGNTVLSTVTSMRLLSMIRLGFFCLIPLACSQETGPAEQGAAAIVTGEDDVGVCVSTFGDQLTPGFGRIDGTLVALVRPVIDEHCAMPNRDHLILEVEMNGAVYRMV